MIRSVVRIVLLAVAFGLATATFGWWTVPVLGVVWGAVAGRGPPGGGFPAWWEHPGRTAALAAALAWLGLWLWTALNGPMGTLLHRLSGVLGLPGVVLIGMTLLYPAAVAGVAGYLAGVVQRAVAPGT